MSLDFDKIKSELTSQPTQVQTWEYQHPITSQYFNTTELADLYGDDHYTTEDKEITAYSYILVESNEDNTSRDFNNVTRLSPPLTEGDYRYSLDKDEGACELFDI